MVQLLADANTANPSPALFSCQQILADHPLLSQVGLSYNLPPLPTRVSVDHTVSWPGWELHTGAKFGYECSICGNGQNLCPAMREVQLHRTMSMNQKRLAQGTSEQQAKHLATARNASLKAQPSDLTIPIATTGVDERVIPENPRRRAPSSNPHQHKRQRTSAPSQAQGNPSEVLNLEDEEEEEENEEDEEPQSEPGVDAPSEGQGAETGGVQPEHPARTNIPPSSPANETGPTADPAASPPHPSSSRQTPRCRPSWLEEGFQIPADEAGMKNLCREANDIPKLKGLITEQLEPVSCLLGSTALKRCSDADQVAYVEGEDPAHSAYHAGIQLFLASSTILGLRNKCIKLEVELTEAERERNVYKRKVTRRDASINELKNDLAEAKTKAETDEMDAFDNAILHTLRTIAADGNPAITPTKLAQWGSKTIFSNQSRKGHPLVPYGDEELVQLAAEDAVLGKAPWPVPAIRPGNIVPAWFELSQKNKDALNDAYNAQ